MPSRTPISSSTLISLNATPSWLRIWATCIEKPHCGIAFVPFMKRTTSLPEICLPIQFWTSWCGCVISYSLRGCGGFERQRVQRPAHLAFQRVIHHLVLLHPRLAAKGLRDHGRRIMVAVAGEVLDAHLGIGNPLLDQLFDLCHRHGHRPKSPGLLGLRPILAAGHEARQPALVTRSQRVQGKWLFAR